MRERIERALEAVRPALKVDGGNVELLEYNPETGVVRLRLIGSCGDCPMSMMTLKMGIERAVRQSVPEVKQVVAI
uniref:NifU family protein n=1 Tax=Caldinitratiruptor microaerophilus TaxID=671077 RepID=UPI00222F00CB|nr:NifU family protein [Caldinitratiruptor microaerophilus]